MKKTAIVTLTFNKLEKATKPFLESLYKFTDEKDFDLIIVDNNSTDGTLDYLKDFAALHSNIKLIFNSENLGYSKGNNIGLKEILNTDYEYVGLLNNDILFTPNWLENTISGFAQDEKIGMASPRSNEHCKLTAQNYLQGYKKFIKRFRGDVKYTLAPFFSCVIIKKEVINKIGLLDEAYTPAFWEDWDYAFRAQYAGYSMIYVNNAFIFHNHSTTSSALGSEISERNKKYFFNKHPLGKYIFEHKRSNIIKDILRYIKESFEK